MRAAAYLMVSLLTACATEAAPDLTPDDGFDDTMPDGKADSAADSAATVHRFTDKALFPEGGAFDPTDKAFFVGSIGRGNITRVAADGSESIFYAGGEADRYTLGMQVDNARRLLWVCTTKSSLGTIWIFDLTTKARLRSIDLTAIQPKAACNDVLIDRDGTALVSDRENPYIYRVDAAGHAAVWATSPLLEGAVVSLNSMDFTPNHDAVLTATYLPPSLVRVSTSNPRDVRKVALDGAMFMDGFNVLNGPDDLVMREGELIVAFGSSIKRVTPDDATWRRATVHSTRTIGGVTALIQNGEELYGANGQSVRYLLKVSPSPFQIFRIDADALN